MSSHPKTILTPEQYLEIERKAEYKSEYFQGEMFAMPGASEPHNVIAGNLGRELGVQLRSRPCRIYPSDMRVHIPETGLYTYPDVSVVCQAPQLIGDRKDTLLNPVFIAEILSPSTEAYDRGRKLEHYRSIASLKEYLLIAQDRVHVELYRRNGKGQWMLSEATGFDASIQLDSIDCQLSLADLYEKVDLAPNS
jgi:Uma2 family endonuclease